MALLRKREVGDLVAGLEQQLTASLATRDHLQTTLRAIEARRAEAQRLATQLRTGAPIPPPKTPPRGGDGPIRDPIPPRTLKQNSKRSAANSRDSDSPRCSPTVPRPSRPKTVGLPAFCGVVQSAAIP